VIDLLIKSFLLVWPFGHFLDVRVGDSFIIPLLDILASTLLFSSIPRIIKSIKVIKKDPLFLPIIFFLTISALSLLLRIPDLGFAGIIRPSLYLLRLITYLSLYFTFKVYHLKKYTDHLKLSAVIFVFFGLIQYLFSPNMSFIKYIGFDDHFYRLIGTLLDPNFTGAILASLSIFLISSGYLKLGLVLLIPLALTFSRASYISYFLPLFTYSLIKKKYLLFILPALLGLVVLFAPKPFGEGVNLFRTFSIFSRIGSAQQGLTFFVQRPIFGWGYNTLITDTGRVGIDNSYIFLLATTGILGFVSFIIFLIKAFMCKTLPVRLALMSILVHAMFNNTIFFPWILAFVVILLVKDEK